jgi:peroxiredoxin
MGLARQERVAADPGGAEAHPATLFAALGLQHPRTGAEVVRFALKDPEGRAVSADGLRGKVVLLSFFATWCPACTAERPSLRELAARFRGAEFALVLVNYGEPEKTVRAFTQEVPFAHATLLDPQTRLGERLGVKFLPTHFLIDPRGRLVAIGVRPKAWDGPEAAQLIERLLGHRAEAGGPSLASERRGI